MVGGGCGLETISFTRCAHPHTGVCTRLDKKGAVRTRPPEPRSGPMHSTETYIVSCPTVECCSTRGARTQNLPPIARWQLPPGTDMSSVQHRSASSCCSHLTTRGHRPSGAVCCSYDILLCSIERPAGPYPLPTGRKRHPHSTFDWTPVAPGLRLHAVRRAGLSIWSSADTTWHDRVILLCLVLDRLVARRLLASPAHRRHDLEIASVAVSCLARGRMTTGCVHRACMTRCFCTR